MNSGHTGLKRLTHWHQGIAGKTTAAILLTLLFATIHFSQKYGWSQATGRELSLKDTLLIYLGYELLAVLSVLIFWFHIQFPINKSAIVKAISGHLAGMVLFASLHSLLFSFVYYLINPAWQAYSFWLLLKDVALNYFNTGLIFYLMAILFAELYNSFLRTEGPGNSPSLPEQATLRVKDQSKTHIFQLTDIAYFTSADNYVKVHCGEQTVLMRESMASLEKRLDPEIFLRVHRTALINKNFISQIVRTGSGEMNLVMKDEAVLPISRRRKDVKLLLQKPD
ncbi:MAG: LytTR family transcriptional regulator [Roseivirga sp.]|nr:LytTR family transcriptional regulator [Roseivirga sp.]